MREQVIVVGASLFIPVFFIDLGLMLDLPVFVRTMLGSPAATMTSRSCAASAASWRACQFPPASG